MASIHREIQVRRSREDVWDAVRDVGAIHKRLVPGFVVDCRLEGDSRHLTFGNGMQIREIIIDVDDQRSDIRGPRRGRRSRTTTPRFRCSRRNDTCRLVWIADVMPHAIADTVAEMIQQGLDTMKATLRHDVSRRSSDCAECALAGARERDVRRERSRFVGKGG